ncbi:MAG: cysteine desulfurase NifS [Clostridium sp.]|uniref:cysteine desulfurase NifS n=1 Tax=Clostridium sp. TaxID=1506 RepID=UPI002907D1D9|nr:cysteine desulfurase NifS [Clostridium sp.]MDU7338219.1 cysteine desulfurase NifS [Clostridium sp.]
MSRFVYADNAATTPITEPVLRAMMPYLTESYGNPSSMYSKGREAKRALELARESIAECIGARPGEIYFTAGGSESDNWAIKGIARELALQGKKHLITTCFEHHAVLHAAESLEREGFSVTYLPVHENGLVRPEEVANAIREDTALVSVMYANNEIGTIQPIAEIGSICRERGVLFHTDAVQAIGILPIDVAEQNIDLLSLSGHKLHAPKGIGALYVRRGITIQNLVDGGAQERGRRAGTENVAAIVGLATAMRDACATMKERADQLCILRDRLIEGALQIPGSSLNGDAKQRLPGNVNLCLHGVDGEAMLLLLDRQGICASSGSACTAGSLEASHVLLAIGIPPELAKSSLRLTLGDQNTEEDIEYILSVLPAVIERLRTS